MWVPENPKYLLDKKNDEALAKKGSTFFKL